jgi:hypothetical protein
MLGLACVEVARRENMKKAAANVDKVDNIVTKEEGMTLKELIVKLVETGDDSKKQPELHLMTLYMEERIMKLSPEELKKEATFEEGEDLPVLSRVAIHGFPIASIARLCNVVDIDMKDTTQDTAIMLSAYQGNHDIVDYLARRDADLSIIDEHGHNYLFLGRGKCIFRTGRQISDLSCFEGSRCN